MLVKTGIGVSIHENTAKAAKHAVKMALEQNPDPDVTILFGSIWHDQAVLLAAVNRYVKGCPVFGCSSYVEFSSAGLSEKSVLVVTLSSAHIRFHRFTQEIDSNKSCESARSLMQQVIDEGGGLLSGRSVGLFLPDVYGGDCVEYLNGIKDSIGNRLPLVGGGCSNQVFKDPRDPGYWKNYQYMDDRLLENNFNLLVMEPLDDRITFSFAYDTVWSPVAPPVSCTRQSGDTLYEVDGVAVMEYYRRYLGDGFLEKLGADILSRYPFLLIYDTPRGQRSNVICVFDFDQKAGSARIYPPLDVQGAKLQLVCLNREDLVLGAAKAVQAAREALGDSHPELCVIFNCQLRRNLLQSTVQKEIASIISVLGGRVPLVGFYAMGEFGPLYNRYDQVVDPDNPFGGTFPFSTSTSVLMIGAKGEPDGDRDYRKDLSTRLEREKERMIQGKERETIEMLKQKLDDSEEITLLSELALKQINKQNYEMAVTIKRQYEELSRLQTIIKQHTPVNVWEKAGFFSRQGATSIPNEELHLTMMFMDIKGFTSYAEKHTAQEVIGAINDIFAPATDLIYRHEGDVDKYIGDCIFAIFPNPLAAVLSAMEIQLFLREHGGADSPFSIRIGINSGRVVSGNVGSDTRCDNTLIGDAVNTAQRLESNCAPGCILLSDDCYQAVRHSLPPEIQSVAVKQVALKGKKEPMTVHELSLDE